MSVSTDFFIEKKDFPSFKIYLRLLTYLKPHWFIFALSIIGYVIFASSQTMLAALLKYFVDGLSLAHDAVINIPLLGDVRPIYGVPVALLLITLWQGLGGFLGGYYTARVSLFLVHDLRMQVFSKLLRLPNQYFDSNSSGYVIQPLTNYTGSVTSAATDSLKILFREGLTVVFLFAYLLWSNWQLTMVLVVVMPFIALMAIFAARKFRKHTRQIMLVAGKITHIVIETIQNYRTVRSFGAEKFETKRLFAASKEATARQIKLARTEALYTPALQLVVYSAMGLLMFLVLLLRGDASVGDLVAYITAAGLIPKPMRQLSTISASMQKGLVAAQGIFGLLDNKTEEDNGKIEKQTVKGELTIKNLSFAYPKNKELVLDNINFRVKSGQMVALVGRSGSGKTTLTSLISRFYPYDEGEILLDDIKIEDYTLTNLRSHIALVNQHVSMFDETVFNNIAYGDLQSKSLAEVKKAADAAYATEFIEKLPKGFDTVIGESGMMLSGGQRQRIAIARALLKNAPLLILDEATSALDNESEQHIQRALEELMQGRTTFVIAHRLSTIKKADLILVMDNGKIVEQGTHQELLALNKHYANLYSAGFQEDEIIKENKKSKFKTS